MKYLLVLLLTIGIFSCIENKKTGTKLDTKPGNIPTSELKGFELIEEFKSNKAKFNSDTLELLSHSTDGGELIVYHDNEFDYVVLDFWLYGETGKLNYTYWTDNDFKFEFIRKVNYKYDKPYYEKGFKVDTATQYLIYSQSKYRLFDSNKNEITDTRLTESTKIELEKFYKDLTEGVEIKK